MNVKESRYNYGVALLRTILAFLVVILHVVAREDNPSALANLLLTLSFVAVPIFMMLAFYYSAKVFESRNVLKEKLPARLKRILIPYVFWPIGTYTLYLILDFVFGTSLNEAPSELLWNYVIGGWGPAAELWFQWVLFFLTVFFAIVVGLWNKESKSIKCIVVFALSVICIVMEYTGTNYSFFMGINERFSFVLGRFIEMLPFAGVGYLLYQWDLLEKCKNHAIISMFSSLVIIGCALVLPVFPMVEGFGYQGLRLMLLAIGMLIFFYSSPWEKMPEVICRLVKFLGGYAMGVYLTHYMVYCLLKQLFFASTGVKIDSLLYSLIVWGLSMVLSIAISKIPGKFVKAIIQ